MPDPFAKSKHLENIRGLNRLVGMTTSIFGLDKFDYVDTEAIERLFALLSVRPDSDIEW